ncbi:uncharacterized protein si:ch211-151h10.2 isoform X1 [Micropterus salmoides]|uniref:uncharacterized protein si:ch211-151h10.2 isoform X1 n=2 Tax=Micropterus salmoides TaxID=27706 RepID=UPI0018EAD490|nr:uncharacterized protein si:ch211-151h10.2 isoform X1 [Micropterus salmoides]
MPRLTVAYPKGQGGRGQRERGGLACKWMEEVKEDSEGVTAEGSRRHQSSSYQTTAVRQQQQRLWSQILRTLRPWKGWYSFPLVGVVWSVCQVDAPLHSSLLLVDVGWRLLLVCLLWMVMGGGVYALRYCLRPGHNQGEPPLRTQPEVMTENRNNQYSWMSQSRNLGHNVSLALALADGLLLCVLQEPLLDPSVLHIKALLYRLESVSLIVGKADIWSEVTLKKVEQESILIDKVNLIRTYLQQRTRSLCRLVQVQGAFEASVKEMLEGLHGLWAQLEELHMGVTLTKEGSRGHRDLALAQTDAETLFAVLGHYRDRLQCCQIHLKDSTQQLQELTWSHTHISNRMSSNSESVWPELLLQSNIEQFDKVQESFLSLEQQTSTFQAHLEGLGKEKHANVSPQTSLHLHSGCTSDVSLEQCNSTSASTSVSSMDADTDTETDAPLSLCERSALHLSSTIGRMRKSGQRK